MAVVEISGIRIPDSRLTREATEFVRETVSAMLFEHSTRVYFWGAFAGQRRGLRFDPELLYTAAMFHDVGLTAGFKVSHLRFGVTARTPPATSCAATASRKTIFRKSGLRSPCTPRLGFRRM